ncbi:MAG TPA: hypothetical protein VN428_21975 [Bryobacteraceae bacterium]|nr:hypothetical protein [Bryobacteraceae bacterium]
MLPAVAAASSDNKWVVTASRIDAESFEQFYEGRRPFISASMEQAVASACVVERLSAAFADHRPHRLAGDTAARNVGEEQ